MGGKVAGIYLEGTDNTVTTDAVVEEPQSQPKRRSGGRKNRNRK